MEALVSFLNHVEVQGKIMGMQYACSSPLMSYLSFADDNFFLARRSPVNVTKL